MNDKMQILEWEINKEKRTVFVIKARKQDSEIEIGGW